MRCSLLIRLCVINFMPLSVVLKIALVFVSLLYASIAVNAETLDSEMRESIVKIDVTVSDMYRRTETKQITLTIFRPPGENKSPLLILNHGRAVQSKRHLQGRQRMLNQARWFVEQGFVVIVPTRIGYGDTYSEFDPEYVGQCNSVQLDAKERAIYQQILTVHEFAKTQSFIDTSHWLVAGQSLGGFVSVTVGRKAPEGLIGAINFAGGYGGDPDTRRGNSCSPWAWERSLAKQTSERQVPILWVYWKDDWYWGNETPVKWFKSFQTGGGTGEFVQSNPITGDGHSGFYRDFNAWIPVVYKFLSSLPINSKLTLKEPFLVPQKTEFAKISETEKVPYISEQGKYAYRKFLNSDSSRAFAINPDGRFGWSVGHWNSPERALRFCNQSAKKACRLYAVDEAIVWNAEKN